MTRRNGSALRIALASSIALTLACKASAASPPAATPATQETGVWRTTCGEGADAPCQLVQYAALRLGEPPLFLMSVTRDAKTGKPFGIVTTPLRVYLAPGLRIAVDGKRPFKVLFELCDETGCHAGFRFDGAIAEAFRKGAKADVTVWTAKDKAVVVPVALDGFSKAYEQLKEGERP